MTILLAFALALLGAVLLSAWAERTVLSTAVLFLVAGVVVGRGWFGVVTLPPGLLGIVAELSLFSVLFTDGMRAAGQPKRGPWRLVGRTLLFAMPLTIVTIAALARWLLGLSWLDGLLMGAVLSPTDPIFVSAIFSFDAVPERLRRLLNLESGLNDGIALPVVVVLLAEAVAGPPQLVPVLVSLAAGLGIGVAIPWCGIRLEESRYFGAVGRFRPLNAFALGLLVLALSWRLNANIFLAAFAAGASVAYFSAAVREAFERFGGLITELLKLAAILIFGLTMAPTLFSNLHGSEVAFILLALFAARLVAMEISLLGTPMPASERLAAGWFGPKGFASVVYALMVLDLNTAVADRMAHLIGVTIALSIVVYSSTDILVGRWFEAHAARRRATPDEARKAEE